MHVYKNAVHRKVNEVKWSFIDYHSVIGRTALLIRCSKNEGTLISAEAQIERRTVSNYVLNVVMRAVEFETF